VKKDKSLFAQKYDKTSQLIVFVKDLLTEIQIEIEAANLISPAKQVAKQILEQRLEQTSGLFKKFLTDY
jgi:type I site-specific restriction endonuclease